MDQTPMSAQLLIQGWLHLRHRSLGPRPWLLLAAIPLGGLLLLAPANQGQAAATSRSQILRIDGHAGKTNGVLRQGPLVVTVRRELQERVGSKQFQAAAARVRVHGRVVGQLEGSGSEGGPSAVVQLAEMDPSNPYPEVYLSSYSFGAHCCNYVQVLSSNRRGTAWRLVTLKQSLDGGAEPAQDPLGNGRYLVVSYDTRFLYRFDCYACSHPPRRIWQLQGDRFVDISHRPEMRPLHRQRLQQMAAWFRRREKGSSYGFLAGYVATKARLGQLREAWSILLQRYDRHSEWELSDCRGEWDARGRCRGRELVYRSFPEALYAFLVETGYIRSGTRL
ncbi:MAG: hypothetical protein ACKO5F_06675 [Synechococcus sp.]